MHFCIYLYNVILKRNTISDTLPRRLLCDAVRLLSSHRLLLVRPGAHSVISPPRLSLVGCVRLNLFVISRVLVVVLSSCSPEKTSAAWYCYSVFTGDVRVKKNPPKRCPCSHRYVWSCCSTVTMLRFFGVLSLHPSLWFLVYWSRSRTVGFSWPRCALWTPARLWRSSTAVLLTVLLCSPAAIRMLEAFQGQTPQDYLELDKRTM